LRNISPPPFPHTIEGILNVRDGVRFFAGDGIDPLIVYSELYEPSGFLARQTGEVQGESEGSITSAASIFGYEIILCRS